MQCMMRRVITTLAVGATLIVPAALVGTTTAQQTGTFDATNVGAIVAQGRFSAVFGTIEGTGTLLVRDPSGTAVVKLGAKRQRPKVVKVGARKVRVYTIRKAKGAFFVQGKGLRVELRSASSKISISLFGRGSVTRLSGDGEYKLNTDPPVALSAALLPLQIKPPPPAPRQHELAVAAGATA
jgi:hypothetical protein